jgi:hypothetical protein
MGESFQRRAFFGNLLQGSQRPFRQVHLEAENQVAPHHM